MNASVVKKAAPIYHSFFWSCECIPHSHMAPPTLFVKGSLRDPLDDPAGTEKLAIVTPIDHCEAFFRARMNLTGPSNRLLILKAGTASSKSTGFVAEMYKRIVTTSPHGRRGMIVTQPRVLTAIKNVSQITSVPQYSYLREGVDIGWSTQYNKLRPKRFGILSATIGTLVAQIILNGIESVVDGYQMICIDETHERSLQTDLVILMLRRLLDAYRNDVRCPFVVFMSATFDPTIFVDYFKVVDPRVSLVGNFIHVVGQSVGYDVKWPDVVSSEVPVWKMAADRVAEIIRDGFGDAEDSCDVLIFMPGAIEIEETTKALRSVVDDAVDAGLGYTYVIGISSKDVASESIAYRNLDKKNSEIRGMHREKSVMVRRKVVISTNIAETGLTLDELKYVIDSGFHRGSLYNPVIKTSTLMTEATPKSRVTQRFGRVGRKTRGVVYPLYTRETFDSFADQQFPEMITENFSDVILAIINTIPVPDDIRQLGLITNPPLSAFENGFEVAYKLGMITPDVALTSIGKMTIDMSVKMHHGRLIAGSIIHGYSTMDIIGLVAFLEEFSGRDLAGVNYTAVYEKYFGDRGEKIRAVVADDFIDIVLLGRWIVELFDVGIPDIDGIVKTTLKMKAADVRKYLSRRDQLLLTALSIGLDVTKGISIVDAPLANATTILKYVIHDAFKTNLLTLKDGAYTYKGMRVTVPSFKRNRLRDVLSVEEVVYPQTIAFDELTGETRGSGMIVTAYRVSAMSGYVYVDEH